MTIGNKNIQESKNPFLVILGAGESGVGTAFLAQQKGWKVFVSDNDEIKENYKDLLNSADIEWEEKGHTEELIFKASLVMKSPGIPQDAPLVNRLRGSNIKIVSEIEFAWAYTSATIVAITGSNGKTTTTRLTHHILDRAGLNAGMAGNIGESFARQVAEDDKDVYLLELSSFQLESIEEFRPHIAVMTSLAPDHLDRYRSYEEYVSTKFRIVKNQTERDFFIYDADNETIAAWLSEFKVKPKNLPLSLKENQEEGALCKDNQIIINLDNTQTSMSTSSLSLKGEHNIKNAMAASTVAKLLKIRKDTIRESLESFQGVEHRLEKVLKINNVQYVNDSKATNVNATYYALESMDSEVVWIVGGVDKGNDYSELLPLVHSRVKAIICLGLDNKRIFESFGNCVDTILERETMENAVRCAYSLAEKGNTVLLSPACASFDLFENAEDRGRQFKEAVRNL